MVNKKKIDLTDSQNEDLDLFEKKMELSEWQLSGNFKELFDQGWAVPFQAEYKRKNGEFSSIVRYMCGDINSLNITFHQNKDNQMVEIRFKYIDAGFLDDLMVILDDFFENGVREALFDLCKSGFDVVVNLDDDYHPLNEDLMRKIYN